MRKDQGWNFIEGLASSSAVTRIELGGGGFVVGQAMGLYRTLFLDMYPWWKLANWM
jgi:hypothetical protein